MEKILVSSCFLGDNVRYNAKIKALSHHYLTLWHNQGRLVKVCPEVAGGLPTPRPAAEILPSTGRIMTAQGQDVSQAFHQGAYYAQQLCQKHNIAFALLKESSPSCGSQWVYDGSFNQKKIIGQGITARLLSAQGIQVFSEDTIEQLANALATLTKNQ